MITGHGIAGSFLSSVAATGLGVAATFAGRRAASASRNPGHNRATIARTSQGGMPAQLWPCKQGTIV